MINDTSFFGPAPPYEAKARKVFDYMRNVYAILIQMIHEHLPELQERGIPLDTLHITDFKFYVKSGDEIMKHEEHWKNYENALQFRDINTFLRNSQTHPTSTTNLQPRVVQTFHRQNIAPLEHTPNLPNIVDAHQGNRTATHNRIDHPPILRDTQLQGRGNLINPHAIVSESNEPMDPRLVNLVSGVDGNKDQFPTSDHGLQRSHVLNPIKPVEIHKELIASKGDRPAPVMGDLSGLEPQQYVNSIRGIPMNPHPIVSEGNEPMDPRLVKLVSVRGNKDQFPTSDHGLQKPYVLNPIKPIEIQKQLIASKGDRPAPVMGDLSGLEARQYVNSIRKNEDQHNSIFHLDAARPYMTNRGYLYRSEPLRRNGPVPPTGF